MQSGARDRVQRPGDALSLGQQQRSASYASRPRSNVDSWIEISSQPSSSSLSSIADEIVTTGLRVQHDSNSHRRRRPRPGVPTHLNIESRSSSAGGTSSQEEYEESESESDRVMTSSNEGPPMLSYQGHHAAAFIATSTSDDDDENRTAINYPIGNEHCFTPQPNAFSHPPVTSSSRAAGQSVPGSYFPSAAARPGVRPSTRHSYPAHEDARAQHSPYNMIAPSHSTAAADHEAALRASLSTLLSCAAAARGLPKSSQRQVSNPATQPGNRIEPGTLRMVPESQLLGAAAAAAPTTRHPPLHEPTFRPTIRRHSTSTSASTDDPLVAPAGSKDVKRKAVASSGGVRNGSKDRARAVKKARRTSSSAAAASGSGDEMNVSPTVLTWVVSAGVVVVLSALSFSAGYAMGKEAGRFEATGFGAAGEGGSCAREAGRSGLGLRRLRFAAVA